MTLLFALLLALNLPTTVETERVQGELGAGVAMHFAVASTPEALIDALWRDGNFQAVFPSVVASEVLSEREGQKTLRMTERYMGLESTYTLVLTRSDRSLSYVQGPDERMKMEGSIVARPVGQEACRVSYTGYADMGMLIPEKTLLKAMEDMAPEIAENTRALVAEAP